MAKDRTAAFERFSRTVDGPMMVLALAARAILGIGLTIPTPRAAT